MRIPGFWAVAEGSGTDPDGDRLFRRVWGWSMSSTAEALVVAQERLRSALASLSAGTRGGSYYPRVPLREPILDELVVDGEQVVVVTRNRYGADILNTDRVLIADVDLPEQSPGGWLRGLFRKPAPDPALERVGVLAEWAGANPWHGVIVYRTASGLRVFVTGVDEPATSARGEQILAELDSDPIYRELCRAHGTFRARLTPKPWRLSGMKAPSQRWPFADSKAEGRFQRWLGKYQAASREYAVCRRLAAHGPAPSALEEQVIRLHDERTGVSTSLPLA